MLTSSVSETFTYPAPQTLLDAIKTHATLSPEAAAIVFGDLSALSYRALHEQIRSVGNALEHAGIGGRNRVAIIMPDGPALAIAIAAVACHATVVPLNPALTAAEIEDLFVTLGLDAVVAAEGANTPARAIALRHHAAIFDASQQEHAVRLVLRTKPRERPIVDVRPDDPAIILRTSGTTARPKFVPVTHRNLQSMAARRQHWFGLGPQDRGICVMPLYYAQGIYNALFGQLLLGASVAFPSRTRGGDFCSWLSELRPTWYSAGPTFHRSVLERARSIPKDQLRHALRFIQSGAAPLPPAIHEGLENVFGVPLLDTYGLTEAGNIAANMIAPSGRRYGTLGKAWPGELAILGRDGNIAEIGGPGEIVLRGPGLTPGYIDEPEANRAASTNGWFRTGDIGRIDADGFLTVVGRIKELINRGGEKVAPAEIDEALQRHPAVLEAAAFPVPHPRLGEDVAAAVILRPGAAITSLDLRRFLQAALAPFKIPRRIHLVSSLPKGDTGKVLRKELTRLFGAPAGHSETQWTSALEIEIAAIWQSLLDRDGIGPSDDFFELGGDSLLAVEMLCAIERLTARNLPKSILFEAATIRQLAQLLGQEEAPQHQPIIQLSKGSRAPFFFFHGAFNTGGGYTKKLASLLGPDQPLFVVSPHGLDGTPIPRSLEAMAADRLPLVQRAQPSGPYRLGGYCLSGLVAFEVARLLMAAGEEVDFVAMIDPPTTNARPSVRALLSSFALTRSLIGSAVDRPMAQLWKELTHADKASELSREQLRRGWVLGLQLWWDWLTGAARSIVPGSHPGAKEAVHVPGTPTKSDDYTLAMSNYRPAPLAVRTIYFESEYGAEPWRRLSPDLEVIKLSGDHGAVVYDPTEIAEYLRAILAPSGALEFRLDHQMPLAG